MTPECFSLSFRELVSVRNPLDFLQVFIILFISLLSTINPCQAGELLSYNAIYLTWTDGGGVPFLHETYNSTKFVAAAENPAAEAAGLVNQGVYGFGNDSVSASADLLYPWRLHAYSVSQWTNANSDISNISSAVSVGYRDIITLNTPGPAPDALRFYFSFDGSLDAGIIGAGNTLARSYIITSTNNVSRFFEGWNNSVMLQNGPVFSYSVNGPYGPVDDRFFLTPFDQNTDFTDTPPSLGPQAIGGVFHIDVPKNVNGQYEIGVILGVSTSVRGGGGDLFAIANFGDTLALSNVSLTDGTPIDYASLHFDSGVVFSPVPEPSSFALLGGAIVASFAGVGGGVARAKILCPGRGIANSTGVWRVTKVLDMDTPRCDHRYFSGQHSFSQ